MDYKTKGNIAGYVAVFLLFILFIWIICSIVIDFHFRCDVVFMFLLIAIFEECRKVYLKYRIREIDEILKK